MRWFFPTNQRWDMAVATAVNAGGAVGEIAKLAGSLTAAAERDDVPGLVDGLRSLTLEVEAIARGQQAEGHTVGSGESLTRAAVYARTAAGLATADAERAQLERRAVDLFAEGAVARFERVSRIALERDGRPGVGAAVWLQLPAQTSAPVPVVVVLGGAGWGAELLVQLLAPAAVRGMAVLALEAPGPDAGGLASDVLGAIDAHPGLDGDRVALIGVSTAVHAALTVAATEPRIRAVGVWGAVWDLGVLVRRTTMDADARRAGPSVADLARAVGGSTADDAVAGWSAVHCADVAASVTVPVHVVHGESDRALPVVDAYRLHAALGPSARGITVVPAGRAGEEHLQWDGVRVAQQALADSLRAVLVGPSDPVG